MHISIAVEASPLPRAYRPRMSYTTRLLWTGNRGDDTARCTSYGRVADSCSVPIRHEPTIHVAAEVGA